MISNITRRVASLLGVLLVASIFISCSSNAATTTVPTPTSTVKLATPTTTVALTPTVNQSSLFQPFTGSGFTIKYPSAWKASQSKTNTGKVFYSFLYSDQITGFHVELHSKYSDATTPIADLTGADMNCNSGDTALPTTKQVHGITWYQNDILCLLASTYYEVRLISYTNPKTNDTTTIVYGAYQQATASPIFTKAEKDYFEPMWESFQFTS